MSNCLFKHHNKYLLKSPVLQCSSICSSPCVLLSFIKLFLVQHWFSFALSPCLSLSPSVSLGDRITEGEFCQRQIPLCSPGMCCLCSFCCSKDKEENGGVTCRERERRREKSQVLRVQLLIQWRPLLQYLIFSLTFSAVLQSYCSLLHYTIKKVVKCFCPPTPSFSLAVFWSTTSHHSHI